jgi:hypothetical protein
MIKDIGKPLTARACRALKRSFRSRAFKAAVLSFADSSFPDCCCLDSLLSEGVVASASPGVSSELEGYLGDASSAWSRAAALRFFDGGMVKMATMIDGGVGEWKGQRFVSRPGVAASTSSLVVC